jgi:hypothetical protein
MQYAITVGLSQAAETEGITQAITEATNASLANPRRIVRIFDTLTDELVFSYRNGEPEFHG